MNVCLAKFLRPMLAISLCCIYHSTLLAEEILVAVASNFSSTAEEVAERFEQQTGHEVVLAFGSTGHHYAQIVNGAPFDIFLAADAERPRLLEESGIAIEGSRFTYALGQLVLWGGEQILSNQPNLLRSGEYRHLALANPRFAPYGVAAMEVLEASNLIAATEDKIVLGENIAQAFQFVASGAAQLGFVSLAQVNSMPNSQRGFVWQIEPSLYNPIRQQAVLLSDNPAAMEFMSYLKSDSGAQLIGSAGYGLEPL